MSTQNPFSENPYQAPPDNFYNEYQDMPPQDWSLGWILFSFEGRIPRRVYWGATIGTTLAFYALVFAIGIAAASISVPGIGHIAQAVEAVMGFVILILYFPMLWISLAIQAKRWHDRDKSAWWILIGFVPLIGPLWVLIEVGCLRGTYGPNQYGADQT